MRLKLLMSICLVLVWVLTASAQRVYVAMSNSKPHYQAAETGFWEALSQAGFPKSALTTKTFDLSIDKGQSALEQIQAEPPDVVLTLGTGATKFIRAKAPDIPVVFAMVIFPKRNGLIRSLKRPGNNITGVTLDVAIEDQFKVMLQTQPSLKRVGVIYNPEENRRFITRAEKVAANYGLTLVKQEIHQSNKLSQAFEALAGQIDLLWMIPDTTVFPRDANKLAFARDYLIKNATLKQISTYGLAENFVRSGATLSLMADVTDAGKQAGEIVAQLLKGKPISQISVQYPRTVRLSLNLRTATAINLHIPADVIQQAELKID
ncbi:MAG: hypothetical protein D6675_00945 [Gemmatimonadetes bacterium]|nr:MAG: hypothetical protein D6675_00945 [Gemmatimonadota bacterium]